MKRRDFIKRGIQAGIAANALPLVLGGHPVKALGRSVLRSALSTANNGRVLVIVQLAGGNDGLNCVVPYSDPNYARLRPTLGLKKEADNLLVLSDHDTLAFHSSMKDLHELYQSKKLAVLQNVGYPNPDLSHFRGTDIWNTATDSKRFASTGWIGRMLGDLNQNYPPEIIPAGSEPLAIQFGNSLSNLFLGRNGGMGIAINKLPTAQNESTHSYDAIAPKDVLADVALDYVRTIEKESEVYTQTLAKRGVQSNKVKYPDSLENPLASQLANVAQLIASGFSTQVYLVYQAGYDTHSNQLTDQAKLLDELSQAMQVFQQDLEAFGVADKVLTMTYSEFGRRPKENGSGTDHGTAAPLFVMGTSVHGGIWGNDSNLANLVNGNIPFDPQHDFRNVYATMMQSWLGLSNAEITNVLTASPGNSSEVYSDIANWQRLDFIKAA